MGQPDRIAEDGSRMFDVKCLKKREFYKNKPFDFDPLLEDCRKAIEKTRLINLERIKLEDAGLCGDCIGVKLQKEHDPATMDRRVCPMCNTVWQGYVPGNRRREGILATQRKRGVLGAAMEAKRDCAVH